MEYNQILFGQNLKYEREERNLTIEQFATMMDISSSYQGLLERGMRGLTTKNLFKLKELFGISIDEILSNSSDDGEIKHLKMKPIAILEYINNSNFNDLELYLLINMLCSYSELKRRNVLEQGRLKKRDTDLD